MGPSLDDDRSLGGQDFDFEGVFDDDYLYFYADRLGAARSDTETALIAGLLGLEPGMRILDVPCGHGRIANRLAAGGAEVVGIDANRRFLDRAREDAAMAGVDVTYLEGDMRDVGLVTGPQDRGFDAIVNWFTSFGYFDDHTDRGILGAFRRLLRPGGRLVLDQLNRDRILLMNAPLPAPTVYVLERGDDLLIDRVYIDRDASRTHTSRILVRGGRVRRTSFSVRLFTFPELRGWLADAGFQRVEAYAGDGTPFTWQSDRMVILATA